MVSITKRPDAGVTGLAAPIRVTNTRKMQAKWKASAWLTNENNAARATGLNITWTVDIAQRAAKKDPKIVTKNAVPTLKSNTLNLDSLKELQGSG